MQEGKETEIVELTESTAPPVKVEVAAITRESLANGIASVNVQIQKAEAELSRLLGLRSAYESIASGQFIPITIQNEAQ